MGLPALLARPSQAKALDNYEPMEALKGKDYGKSRMSYGDYVKTPTGLQYLDLKVGEGPAAKADDAVVLDWAGYTIGYYGRPFEARNKVRQLQTCVAIVRPHILRPYVHHWFCAMPTSSRW